ncbi:MAG: DNA helicase II [Salinisphaera sp.]|nr:DNA helicase II [Salinisphaera sp.]
MTASTSPGSTNLGFCPLQSPPMNEDLSHILGPLNAAQRAAVAAPPTHQLVLAGAGSGKTRVLTHRVAWLVEAEGVSPFSILAVTFTNKAAREMRGRIEHLVATPANALWVGTFHGIAHRLLRLHWREADLPATFQILDADDQHRLIRRVLKSLDLDEDRWPPRQAQWFINGCKEEGRRPQNISAGDDFARAQMLRIYKAYEEARHKAGLVDFAELLLRAHELIRDNDELQAHYRRRFRHILVDEFQDTNRLQYAWLQVLAGDTGTLFAVGDDDQSIYSWRGARADHILHFARDFPNTTTVRLEQNYRSTATILGAANELIRRNGSRLGKELWTQGADGEPIDIYAAYNQDDEAAFVVNRIKAWLDEGGTRSDAAILYRSNAQSRVFEEALIRAHLPYRIYGGQKFFERAEVKDAMAYLRLTATRADDASFERVVNTPTRGIGATTLDRLRTHARAEAMSLWQAAEALAADGLSARAAGAVRGFLKLIDDLHDELGDLTLDEAASTVIERTGLKEHHGKGEKGEGKRENLDELVSAARSFSFEPDEPGDELTQFLAHAALEAGENQAGEWDESVQLMTLHTAKGLEFPLVFLVGLEEGLFPHARAIEDDNGLEEERRLCYVGMTRAEQRLYLCHAELRRLYGREHLCAPSRFLGEIPDRYLREIRPQLPNPMRRSLPTRPAAGNTGPNGLGLGQRVAHRKFGEGVVLAFEGEGEGDRARIQVNFGAAGSKWLIAGYAKLQPL